MRASSVGPVVLFAVIACSRAAHAYHTQEQHITDESAYTLRHKDFRVGLWKLQYGIVDSLTVGTYPEPWVFRVANLHLKWRYWHNEPWALSVFAAFYHLNTRDLPKLDDEMGSAEITVV